MESLCGWDTWRGGGQRVGRCGNYHLNSAAGNALKKSGNRLPLTRRVINAGTLHRKASSLAMPLDVGAAMRALESEKTAIVQSADGLEFLLRDITDEHMVQLEPLNGPAGARVAMSINNIERVTDYESDVDELKKSWVSPITAKRQRTAPCPSPFASTHPPSAASAGGPAKRGGKEAAPPGRRDAENGSLRHKLEVRQRSCWSTEAAARTYCVSCCVACRTTPHATF